MFLRRRSFPAFDVRHSKIDYREDGRGWVILWVDELSRQRGEKEKKKTATLRVTRAIFAVCFSLGFESLFQSFVYFVSETNFFVLLVFPVIDDTPNCRCNVHQERGLNDGIFERSFVDQRIIVRLFNAGFLLFAKGEMTEDLG